MANMDNSQVPGFNESSDAAFADLVKQNSLISQRNPLISLRPSSLNFSRSCWTTCDLFSVSKTGSSQDDPAFIPFVANDIEAVLSSPPANASATDYMAFWTSLQQLDTTAQVIENACSWCNSSGHLDIAASDLAFEANCSLTGAFYSHYYGSSDFNMTYSDLVPFYRASLTPPYQGMTSVTVMALAASTWNFSKPLDHNLSPALPLASSYATSVLQAAAHCAKDACQSLEYTGNTDLGGIGALATYFMIATITTIFAILSIYYKKHRDFDWRFRNALRKNIITTSVVFWDAVTWLAILTLIAALVESVVSPPTLYEAVLTQWVVYIMINSVGALWALEAYHEPPRDKASTAQHIARLIISLTTCAVAAMSLRAVIQPHDWTQKFDSACYADYLWPLYRAWRVATWFQVFIPVLWGITWSLKFLVKRSKRQTLGKIKGRTTMHPNDDGDNLRTWLSYASATLSLCVLWFDVICIMMFRRDAQDYFGDSYDDNSFGYGQTLAAGFAAQPVVNFFFVLLSDIWEVPAAKRARTAIRQWFQRKSRSITSKRKDQLGYKGLKDLSTPDIPAVLVFDVPSGRMDPPEAWPLAGYTGQGKPQKTHVQVDEHHMRDE